MSLHKITHSQGLVVLPPRGGALPSELSFRINTDGTRKEVAGWTRVGYVPEITFNPPTNPLNVLTVGLLGEDDQVLCGLQALIAEHQERFAECMVWLAPGASRRLRDWVATGCVAPGSEEPDEDPWATVGNENPNEGDENPDEPTEGQVAPEDGFDEPTTAEVRAWAQEQGLDVSDRGKLPAGVIAQYKDAHGM